MEHSCLLWMPICCVIEDELDGRVDELGSLSLFSATSWQARSKLLRKHLWTLGKQKVSKLPKERSTQMATMAAIFKARAVFPPVESLPRSYFLGHHAAGLSKMNTLLSQIDLIVECRDYRVPLTSRNPLFEQSLAGRERIIIYTKRDLGSNNKPADKEVSFPLYIYPPSSDMLCREKTSFANGTNPPRSSSPTTKTRRTFAKS